MDGFQAQQRRLDEFAMGLVVRGVKGDGILVKDEAFRAILSRHQPRRGVDDLWLGRLAAGGLWNDQLYLLPGLEQREAGLAERILHPGDVWVSHGRDGVEAHFGQRVVHRGVGHPFSHGLTSVWLWRLFWQVSQFTLWFTSGPVSSCRLSAKKCHRSKSCV